jgi:hypothetical protein
MTGTPFDDDLAGAELLSARFESAVGGMTPDIGRLVADGAAEGRSAVRRRRIVSGIAAAAVAIVAVGSISYASQNNLFGKGNDHATNTGELVQLVPATSRGLAAALMSHTDDLHLGTLLAVGGTEASSQTTLSGQVAYDLGGGTGIEIDVYASTDRSALTQNGGDGCTTDQAGLDVCRPFTLPDGTKAWYSEIGSGRVGTLARLAAVVAIRDDQLVAVVETMSGTTDLALDQDAIAAIAADPAIGVSTTASFNEVGQGIPGFKDGGLITGDSGSATASPPTIESRAPQPSRQHSTGSGSSH